MTDDLRYALRRIARHKAFSATVVMVLALGIGVSLTVLGAVDALLFRGPPGVRDSGSARRVYVVHHNKPSAPFALGPVTSLPTYTDLRTAIEPVADLAAYTTREVSARTGGVDERVSLSYVSDNFFAVLRASPQSGRLGLGSKDEESAGSPVAVIGDLFWRESLGGRADVIGSTLSLNDCLVTVVGVTPRGFRGVSDLRVDVWAPFRTVRCVDGHDDPLLARESAGLFMVARLRPGTDERKLVARARGAIARIDADHPLPFWTQEVAVARLTAPESSPTDPRRLRMGAAFSTVSVLVLVLICLSAANLMLASGTERARELLVRTAVGARRGRLVRLLVWEVAVLVALAGVAGTLLAVWMSSAAQHLVAGVTVPAVDARVVAEALLVTGAAGLIAGVLPAAIASRVDLASSLRDSSPARRRSRVGSPLVVLCVAGAVVVLVCAGLLGKSFVRAGSVDMGFAPRGLVVATVALGNTTGRPEDWYAETTRARAYFTSAAERIRALPGISSVSVSGDAPFVSMTASAVNFPEWSGRRTEDLPNIGTDRVGAGYFRTMGMRIVRGRDFAPDDFGDVSESAVVNDVMARTYWPGRDPIGRCFLVGPGEAARCLRVVGVVAGVRGVSSPAASMFYMPLVPSSFQSTMSIDVRTRGRASDLVRPVRAALADVPAEVSQTNVRTMDAILEPQLRTWRTSALLFGVGAAVALVIAALGVYGTLSYTVARRTPEVGVRIALGASPERVTRLIVGEGVRTSLVGVALGAAAAVGAAGLLRPLLYEVGYLDPPVYVGAVVTLTAIAVLASYLPARRAAGVDPLDALRAE